MLLKISLRSHFALYLSFSLGFDQRRLVGIIYLCSLNQILLFHYYLKHFRWEFWTTLKSYNFIPCLDFAVYFELMYSVGFREKFVYEYISLHLDLQHQSQ